MTALGDAITAAAEAMHPCHRPNCPATTVHRAQAERAVRAAIPVLNQHLTQTARTNLAAGLGHMTWAECVARLNRLLNQG
ncbi:hypothetical protein [Kribbella deserti]|uniref:Uncharacterized protein n=1 Tax=Kribbella deserti TaxID=1926257 RepID=A0ABV6QND5_9ACTN